MPVSGTTFSTRIYSEIFPCTVYTKGLTDRPFLVPVCLVQPLVVVCFHGNRLVRCCDAGHGQVGAVDEKDEGGEQTDHGTRHAETDDASTAQVQSLDDVAAQEGAASSSWHHDESWAVRDTHTQDVPVWNGC